MSEVKSTIPSPKVAQYPPALNYPADRLGAPSIKINSVNATTDKETQAEPAGR
ncbi:hypothetical protein BZA77DRAFT_355531 [Pyronema omphalodes]|nr:hypothetical protein BZA77DRAFT_355531 [Pyronema omphalodes]